MLGVLKAIVAWAVLWIVCMNVIGFVVRGLFFRPPAFDAPTERVAIVLENESRRMRARNRVLTTIGLLVAVILIWSLYHFWNIWLAAAGLLIMVARLPDLIWEIRNGRKVTRHES